MTKETSHAVAQRLIALDQSPVLNYRIQHTHNSYRVKSPTQKEDTLVLQDDNGENIGIECTLVAPPDSSFQWTYQILNEEEPKGNAQCYAQLNSLNDQRMNQFLRQIESKVPESRFRLRIYENIKKTDTVLSSLICSRDKKSGATECRAIEVESFFGQPAFNSLPCMDVKEFTYQNDSNLKCDAPLKPSSEFEGIEKFSSRVYEVIQDQTDPRNPPTNTYVPIDPNSRKNSKAPTSARDFCEKSKDRAYFRNLLQNPANMLDLVNPTGSLKIGTCWWHSMLLRNANYLSYYSPDQPKPTSDQVRMILKKLMYPNPLLGYSVVEIPGYANLREFSHDYPVEFELAISEWQIMDGGLQMQFLNALGKKSVLSPTQSKNFFREVEEKIKDHRIPFVYLKTPGLTTHSALITGLQQSRDTSGTKVYDITYIDPNLPEKMNLIRLTASNTGFWTNDIEGKSQKAAPHIGRNEQEEALIEATMKFCSN